MLAIILALEPSPAPPFNFQTLIASPLTRKRNTVLTGSCHNRQLDTRKPRDPLGTRTHPMDGRRRSTRGS